MLGRKLWKMSRKKDAEVLLALVPEDGTPIGNTTLMYELDWDAEKYWRVRDALLDEGRLERGRGRGGSVWKVQAIGNAARLAQSEESLYVPLLEVLKTDWAREMRIEPEHIHFEVTARQGKKSTGGTWTRPDITAVSVRTFQHLPGKFIDILTFEVKPLSALDVTAVFEAASHASRATRSYALLQIPDIIGPREDEIIERCAREAARLRVGLILFVSASEFYTWETKVEAPKLDTAPEALDEFLGHLSNEAKRKMQTWK